jgi:small basic protein
MKHWFIILVFLVGIVLGVGGTFLAPNFIDPYLPEAMKRKGEVVEGSVVAKQRKQDWLLITVNTPQGAILATFKKKVEEIELLVERGDTIGLALRRYEPFVEDPVIKRVRKKSPQVNIPLPAKPEEIIPIPPKPAAKEP